MPAELSGWLLDVYADKEQGVVLWLLGEDGQRYRLRQPFTVTFYAAGPFARLRALWRMLRQQPVPVRLARTRREELFTGPVDVLTMTVDTAVQPRLFRQVHRAFPDLDFYDADIPLSVRYAAVHDVFPTLRCRVTVEADAVLDIAPLESRWQLDPSALPLRVMTIAPDTDPAHAPPNHILINSGGQARRYRLNHPRLLLLGLQALLKQQDPDLLLTRWGDTWLLPTLGRWAKETGLVFNPGRDPFHHYQHKQARSYFTYGMVLHRGQQVYLYGRWHIDVQNALMFADYDLDGVLEQARVTGMPVQEMARRSPGAGITAMQMLVALRRGVLVPHTKQQAEGRKSARALLRSDRGGLVFQPAIGLHQDVVEIDFVSMYPAIIERFNISPETVAVDSPHVAMTPELNLRIDQTRRGLLPETLAPILQKRRAIKGQMAQLAPYDCRSKPLRARATALKWLLVVAFGYAGYKRARFGRIETHEAITAYSREALLRAKEAAEQMGYRVLHLYIDGLWVQRAGVKEADQVRPLLDEIERCTGLPIALEGFYKWIAFLPSQADERVPVPNRYFGVFENGELKVRGIALRRHDTPPFVARLQREVLELLAQSSGLDGCLPTIVALVRRRLSALRNGCVTLEALLVSQRLSRTLAEYTTPSPAARAAQQLQAAGKLRHPGQRIRFLYTRGEPGVYAWDLPAAPDPATIDVQRYADLALRAVHMILQPWGIHRAWVVEWVQQEWWQGHLYLRQPLPQATAAQAAVQFGKT